MEFLDLFSGIGGFRRGLERSGHRCIGHVEIDKYANISYMAMYGLSYCKYGKCREGNCCRICSKEVSEHCDGSKCTGEWFAKDIKQLTAGEIPRAEIWTFGFPCTDISLSGKRAGLAGERSGLFFTVAGLLKSTPAEDKPRILIVENVKHLLSSERGGDFTAVLFNLWEAGYDLEWQCVNSKDFGVPQHRERVYLVGYLGGIRGRKVFPVSGANTAVVKKVIGGYQGERVYDADGLSVTLTADGGGAGGKTGLYLCGTKKPEEWMECLKENGNEECGAKNYAGFLTQKKEPDMTKISRQLNVSMGEMFQLINVFSIVLFMLLIYLLTKLIIEKNTTSISMVKILGYENREILSLYLTATTWVVIISIGVSLIIASALIRQIYVIMLSEYSGWLTYYIDPAIYGKMYLMGLAAYAVIAVLQFRHIQKIPMDEALKNVE